MGRLKMHNGDDIAVISSFAWRWKPLKEPDAK